MGAELAWQNIGPQQLQPIDNRFHNVSKLDQKSELFLHKAQLAFSGKRKRKGNKPTLTEYLRNQFASFKL